MWEEFAIVMGVVIGGLAAIRMMNEYAYERFSLSALTVLLCSSIAFAAPYVADARVPELSDIPTAFVLVYEFIRDGGLG